MRKFLISAVAALTLVACGGSGGSNGGNNGFAITSVTPANNSQIPITQAFVANFNNQLDPNTIGNVTLATESGASVLLNCASASSTSIICTPTTTLSYGTNYNLTYGSGIHNAAGNSLNQAIYNYQTYASSGVASVTPSSGSINPNNTTFSFQFGESMNLASLNTSQTPGNVLFYQESPSQTQAGKFHTTTTGVSLPIVCTSTNPMAMTCTLPGMSQLPLNESYTLLLTNKIVSANNVPITPQAVNYQTSNYITPTVTVAPAAGAVALNQLNYTLTFNTAMQLATLNNNITFTDTSDPTQSINIACATSNNILFNCGLSGLNQLLPNHNYTLRLGAGILSTQNIALNPMSVSYSATNYTQPVINFISPPSGAIGSDQLVYTVQFNVPMSVATFTSNVIFLDVTNPNQLPMTCTSNDNINFTCTLSASSLTPGDNYTLSFGAGIQSQQQVPLALTTFHYSVAALPVPTVQYVNPTIGDISINQLTYTARFSVPMDITTFQNGITFTDTTTNTQLNMSCTSTDNVNVQCSVLGIGALTPNHSYRWTIGAGVKSLQGVAVTATSYDYTAAIFNVPRIVSITPAGGAISLTQMSFIPTFSESMNISTFANNVTFTDTTTGGKINISCSSTDNVIVVCTLSGISQLTYQHNYALNFNGNIKSNMGVPIGNTTYNYSASNATIPQVSSISPTNGSQVNYGTQVFTITFSVAMNTSTFSNISLAGGGSISCTATNSNVASCTASNLGAAQSLTLTIPSSVQSSQGVPITAVSYSYITPPVPTISSINPANGSQVNYGTQVFTITFSMAMNTATFSNISLAGGGYMSCTATSSNIATCTASNLGAAQSLTLTIPSTVLSSLNVPIVTSLYSYITAPIPNILYANYCNPNTPPPGNCYSMSTTTRLSIKLGVNYSFMFDFDVNMNTGTINSNNITLQNTTSGSYIFGSCSSSSSTHSTCFYTISGNSGDNLSLTISNRVLSAAGAPITPITYIFFTY